MKTVTKDGVTSVVAQNEVLIPNLTVKDLLSAIPSVASLSAWLCADSSPGSEPIALSVQPSAPRFMCKQVSAVVVYPAHDPI